MKTFLFLFALIIAIGVNAQTGPGGIGKTDGTSDLVLWLDANTINQTDGTNVSSWTDQSGYDNSASAPSGNEPVFETNELNGNPVVSFTASNTEYLRVDDDTSLKPNTISLFVVGLYTSSTSNWSPYIIKTATWSWQKGYGIAKDGSNANQRGFFNKFDVNYVTCSQTAGVTDIITMVYDKSNVELFKNESSQGTDPCTEDIKDVTNYLYLGVSANVDGSGVSSPLDGDIAEAIIIKRNVNSAERIIIHNYLSAKYDKSLSSNDKYAGDDASNGDYDLHIIGIGKESSGSHTKSSDNKGLIIEQNTGFDNGDYLFAGNNLEINEIIYTDIAGVSGLKARWKRIWYFDKTDAGTTMTVDITFDLSDGGFNSNAGTASNYKLLYRSGTSGNWSDAGTASSVSGDQITFSNISPSDGYYTIGTTDNENSTLPIELISFSAKMNKESVNLNWQTAAETNNDFFTIERSANAQDWEQIAQIKGVGNYIDLQTYTAVDKNPIYGINYYRLKLIDFDGEYSYSSIQKVRMASEKKIRLYPNPTKNTMIIEGIDATVQNIRIYNVIGTQVIQEIPTNKKQGDRLVLDLSSLPMGVYFITIKGKSYKVFKHN